MAKKKGAHLKVYMNTDNINSFIDYKRKSEYEKQRKVLEAEKIIDEMDSIDIDAIARAQLRACFKSYGYDFDKANEKHTGINSELQAKSDTKALERYDELYKKLVDLIGPIDRSKMEYMEK